MNRIDRVKLLAVVSRSCVWRDTIYFVTSISCGRLNWRYYTMFSLRFKSLRFLCTKGSSSKQLPTLREVSSGGKCVQRLDGNMRLYQRDGNTDRDTGRPLVLLLGWLFAKPRHITKFAEFYMDNGFDVLTLQVYVGQLMVPRRIQQIACRFLDQVSIQTSVPRPLMFHTFSVGGYIYGEMMNIVQQQPHKYTAIVERVKGVIFDSPVDYNGIPSGVAKGATDNDYLRRAVENGMELFLRLSPAKRKHHINISNIAKQNPFDFPAQFIYSLSDPLCEPFKFKALAENWNNRGVPAFTQVWSIGHHVSTYRLYPEEYRQAVLDFIDQIGVFSQDDQGAVSPLVS